MADATTDSPRVQGADIRLFAAVEKRLRQMYGPKRAPAAEMNAMIATLVQLQEQYRALPDEKSR